VAGAASAQTTGRTNTGIGTRTGVVNGLNNGVVNGTATPNLGVGAATASPFSWVPGVGFVPNGTTGAGAFGTNQFGTGVNQFGVNQFGANQLGNNGFAIDPLTGLPITNGFVNNGVNGFNGFDVNGGFGAGFFPGYGGYGPAYSGPLVDVRGAWGGQGSMVGMRGTGWNGTGVPTLGMNVAAGGVRLHPSRVRVKLTQDPAPVTTRVAGSRQETTTTRTSTSETGEIRGGKTDAQQVKLAGWLTDVMEDRPLREGKIVSMGATGAQVRFTADGEVQTARFPVEEIFFFKRDGALATAASEPSILRTGSQVLIPQPMIRRPDSVARQGDVNIYSESNTIRESVAGSRQELGDGGIRVNGKTVKSRVAGRRQEARGSRRPAK
jgi:hypothetical protein